MCLDGEMCVCVCGGRDGGCGGRDGGCGGELEVVEGETMSRVSVCVCVYVWRVGCVCVLMVSQGVCVYSMCVCVYSMCVCVVSVCTVFVCEGKGR